MRILFDSKLPEFKTPFGTLVPDQVCTLNIHIPSSVQATRVTCILDHDDHSNAQIISMENKMKKGVYIINNHRVVVK